MFFPNAQQFRESALPQKFSLRTPIMKYIWENPLSPEGYQKLVKSCKLFFIKNPIIVLKNLEYYSADGWRHCNSNECRGLFICSHKNKHQHFDMMKIKNKFWISKRYSVTKSQNKNFASSIIPKIFRCDIERLAIYFQELSYDDLKLLATGVKKCNLYCITVKYENNQEVPLEKIIQIFCGADKITINFGWLPTNSGCKSYDDFIGACSNIKKVKLSCILNIFDVPTFYHCLKESKNRTLFEIYCYDDNTYRLDNIINEILWTKSFNFVPPIIQYVHQNEGMLKKMEDIQKKEAAKYQ